MFCFINLHILGVVDGRHVFFPGKSATFLGKLVANCKDTDPQFQQPQISGVVRQMAQDAAASEAEVIQRTAASWQRKRQTASPSC